MPPVLGERVPETAPKTTARNEKSAWSYPLNCSPFDLPSSIYLHDGEEKYLSSSTTATKQKSTKKKDGGEKKLDEYLLKNCDDEKTVSSKVFGDTAVAESTTMASVDRDDIKLLNLNRLSIDDDGEKSLKSRESSDDDTAVYYMQQNETNDGRRRRNEEKPSSSSTKARAALPLRWPGEYGTCVQAPPNRTVTVQNRTIVNNASPSSSSDDDEMSTGRSRTRGQKQQQSRDSRRHKNLHNSSTVNFFCPSAVLKSCMASSTSSSSLCCSSVVGVGGNFNNNNDNNINYNIKNTVVHSSTSPSRSSSSSYSNCDSRNCCTTTSSSKCSSSSDDSRRTLTHFSPEQCNLDASSTAIGAKHRPKVEQCSSTDILIAPVRPMVAEETLDVNYSSSNSVDRRPSAGGNGPSAVNKTTTTSFRRS